MRKSIYLLVMLFVVTLAALTASGQGHGSESAAQGRAAMTALGKATARRIPRARLVEIAEAGHVPQVNSFPKYARSLLDFIAGG